MGKRLAFNRLIHSDWSVDPRKRWTSVAYRSGNNWSVDSLRQSLPTDDFLDFLLDSQTITLAGFDFPIGLPKAFLDKIGVDFTALLLSLNSEEWQNFFLPVDALPDISPFRPFYKRHPQGGRHTDLVRGLCCEAFIDLLRDCDKKTKSRSRAESIFWTVGPKQVGKAALCGWIEVLIPAFKRGANIWPFSGRLSSLDAGRLTLAETYPGEAYQHCGMPRMIRKRTQIGRINAGLALLQHARERAIVIADPIKRDIEIGFGEKESGEDPFDAVAGLISMIEVAEGRRCESPKSNMLVQQQEGWILGQVDLPME